MDPKCILWGTLVDNILFENIMNVLQEKVQMNTTIEPLENVTQETLETATEMFTYLFSCPPKEIISFYKHLLNTGTPKDIMIAMSNILRISQNAARESSYRIFIEAMTKMNLNQYGKNDIHTEEGFNVFKDKPLPKTGFF